LNERALFALLTGIVAPALTARGFAGVGTQQGEQPRIGGAPGGPTVILTPMGLKRFGFLARKDEWVPAAPPAVMRHTETQQWEASFQVNALYPIPARAANETVANYVIRLAATPAASDLVRAVSDILQSDAGRTALAVGGCGILRVQDVRQTSVALDRDQFERVPSFDFTLVYSESQVTETPHTHDVRGGVVAV